MYLPIDQIVWNRFWPIFIIRWSVLLVDSASPAFSMPFQDDPSFQVCFHLINNRNYVSNLMLFQGIQKHIIYSMIGGGLGKTIDGWRNDHLAERDAVLRHYVETHPEDFPDPGKTNKSLPQWFFVNPWFFILEPKKFGEVLQSWVPIR